MLFSLDQVESAIRYRMSWIQETGAKGGKYWKNTETHEKRYQASKPGESGGSGEGDDAEVHESSLEEIKGKEKQKVADVLSDPFMSKVDGRVSGAAAVFIQVKVGGLLDSILDGDGYDAANLGTGDDVDTVDNRLMEVIGYNGWSNEFEKFNAASGLDKTMSLDDVRKKASNENWAGTSDQAGDQAGDQGGSKEEVPGKPPVDDQPVKPQGPAGEYDSAIKELLEGTKEQDATMLNGPLSLFLLHSTGMLPSEIGSLANAKTEAELNNAMVDYIVDSGLGDDLASFMTSTKFPPGSLSNLQAWYEQQSKTPEPEAVPDVAPEPEKIPEAVPEEPKKTVPAPSAKPIQHTDESWKSQVDSESFKSLAESHGDHSVGYPLAYLGLGIGSADQLKQLMDSTLSKDPKSTQEFNDLIAKHFAKQQGIKIGEARKVLAEVARRFGEGKIPFGHGAKLLQSGKIGWEQVEAQKKTAFEAVGFVPKVEGVPGGEVPPGDPGVPPAKESQSKPGNYNNASVFAKSKIPDNLPSLANAAAWGFLETEAGVDVLGELQAAGVDMTNSKAINAWMKSKIKASGKTSDDLKNWIESNGLPHSNNLFTAKWYKQALADGKLLKPGSAVPDMAPGKPGGVAPGAPEVPPAPEAPAADGKPTIDNFKAHWSDPKVLEHFKTNKYNTMQMPFVMAALMSGAVKVDDLGWFTEAMYDIDGSAAHAYSTLIANKLGIDSSKIKDVESLVNSTFGNTIGYNVNSSGTV